MRGSLSCARRLRGSFKFQVSSFKFQVKTRPFGEIVVMGYLAIRYPNRELLWDGENKKVTNDADADAYIRRQHREGWGP